MEDRTFTGGPGYPLGNIEALAEHPRWYDAVALTDMVTLRGDHETLFDVLEDDFDVALDFLRAMAQGAIHAEIVHARQHGPLESVSRVLDGDFESHPSPAALSVDQPQ